MIANISRLMALAVICYALSACAAAQWRFDEAQGPDVRDATGRGNNGAIVKGRSVPLRRTTNTGVRYLSFANTKGSVVIPRTADLEPTEYTIEIWVRGRVPRHRKVANMVVLAKGEWPPQRPGFRPEGDQGASFALYTMDRTRDPNRGIIFYARDGDGYPPYKNRWVHTIIDDCPDANKPCGVNIWDTDHFNQVVATYDGIGPMLHVNGKLMSLRTPNALSEPIEYEDELLKSLSIGLPVSGLLSHRDRSFFGDVAQVTIWHRVLPVKEIKLRCQMMKRRFGVPKCSGQKTEGGFE